MGRKSPKMPRPILLPNRFIINFYCIPSGPAWPGFNVNIAIFNTFSPDRITIL